MKYLLFMKLYPVKLYGTIEAARNRAARPPRSLFRTYKKERYPL